MLRFTRPAALAAGARVHLLAPSSPFDRDRFDLGVALIGERYAVDIAPSVFARHGFLAGSDEQRLHDLERALEDRAAAAIIPARGGHGATRLLPRLAFDRIAAARKWLVGFSDVTALHACWARAGLCSVHGPMVCSLPEAAAEVRAEWFSLLEGAPPARFRGLRSVRGGRAAGRLFGGNLTVLAALLGTPYFPPLDGTVLALEDTGERPYRIDRMLTSMLHSGALAGVRGIVLGGFTQCEPGPDGVTAEEVLVERLSSLRVPLVADAPFGHIADNRPLLLGAHAELDADSGTIAFR